MLIVDDHEGFRAFARTLFGDDGFDVTAEVADGHSALQAVRDSRPDVVLLDVQLPDIDGIEVAERLAETANPPAVVLTSTRSATDYGRRLSDAPVAGFVPKHELSTAVVHALLDRP